MPDTKTQVSDKGEPGGRQGRQKSRKIAQPGRSAENWHAKDINLEVRIIAEECEDEIERLKTLDRMKNDPSRQTVIDYLREAAIDSDHAERIGASINRFGHDRTFLARGISSPQSRFSEKRPRLLIKLPMPKVMLNNKIRRMTGRTKRVRKLIQLLITALKRQTPWLSSSCSNPRHCCVTKSHTVR